MARYDVYSAQDVEGYLLDVQAGTLEDFPAIVAVPLVLSKSYQKPISRLHPSFFIGGAGLVMLTHNIGTFPRSALSGPITNLASQHERIRDALEMLLHGF